MATTSTAMQRKQGFGLARDILYPWRWYVVAAIASLLISAGVDLLPPLILRSLIDDHISVGVSDGLVGLAFLYLLAIVGTHACSFATTMLSATAAMGGLRDLRVRVFRHLQNLPISYHDRTPVGDSISRCTSDVETLHTLFSAGVFGLLAKAAQIVASLVAMIALSLPLSLILLITLPFVWYLTKRFQRVMREAERKMRLAISKLNAMLQEVLSNIEIVHALRWEPVFVQRFRRQLYETLTIHNRSIWVGSIYSPIMNSLAAAVVALLFVASLTEWFGQAGLTAGTLAAFVMLFQRFFDPIISIGNEWQTVQSALAGIERLGQVLQVEPDVAEEQAGARDAEAEAPRVLVEDLDFWYDEGTPILRNVSLGVGAGEHVAIVGRTGAGKSSLFHLLGGLYHPEGGRIRLNGRDPATLPASERRGVFGTVPQVVRMFQGSVADNIAMHDDAYDRERIEQAVALCGAASFCATLPQGLDTPVGDMGQALGMQLSAGQRQLLALARALVAEPDILLLDEATAAIDSATEQSLEATLNDYTERGGTVITIAHRLSTAANADRILVMERGRIVEEGSPQELLEAKGHFAALWELEQAGWDWRNMSEV